VRKRLLTRIGFSPGESPGRRVTGPSRRRHTGLPRLPAPGRGPLVQDDLDQHGRQDGLRPTPRSSASGTTSGRARSDRRPLGPRHKRRPTGSAPATRPTAGRSGPITRCGRLAGLPDLRPRAAEHGRPSRDRPRAGFDRRSTTDAPDTADDLPF